MSAVLNRPDFLAFQARRPHYARALQLFREINPPLAASAAAAYASHGAALAKVADEVLSFLDAHGPRDYLERYERRVLGLMRLQRGFMAAPSLQTLRGDGVPVDRHSYDVALLASIVFSTHRFAIMRELESFFRSFCPPHARVACVGVGTGYELLLARRSLQSASIEGYDTDPRARAAALKLLRFFGADGDMLLSGEFPFEEQAQRPAEYDAIVLCEVLEHLSDPEPVLRALPALLRSGGVAFVTMAVNLAQEDHVYWYPDVEACRAQLVAAGLHCEREGFVSASQRSASRTVREPPLPVGNYFAVVRPC